MELKSWRRLVSSVALGAGLVWGGATASAADLVAKAPPKPIIDKTLDIHGFFDVSFKNDYITPRGLLVTNTGLTTQILSGIVFDLYKDPAGFINDFSVYGGVWNDLWSKQNHPVVGSWNEFDWFVGGDVVFAKDWKFGVQYVEFLSPPHAFPGIERNVEFSLSYSDKFGWPITINPYVKLFYAVSGPSTVAVGKAGDTYDVEIGMVPTLDLQKNGVPLVVTAPTWVTVGPSTYWNNGATGCGATALTPCAAANTGVVSSGLTGKVPLGFIPSRLGNWYVKGGFQYYHILNDSLLLAQTVTGTATSFATAHKDILVGFAGFGFTF